MHSAHIASILVQTAMGDTQRETVTTMDPSVLSQWGPAGLIVLTFGTVLTTGLKFAGPIIAGWVERRGRDLEAKTKLTEDILNHRHEERETAKQFSERLDRIEAILFDRCGKDHRNARKPT